MIKNFSIKVPNELYVDDFSANTYIDYIYDGPEELIVQIFDSMQVLGIVDNIPEAYNSDKNSFVTINANDFVEVAYYLTENLKDHIYEFETVLDLYGNQIQKVKNPKLSDIYTIECSNVTLPKFEFNLITRNKISNVENLVIKDRNNILNKLKNIQLDSETNILYNEYLSNVENFLNKYEHIYPWNYVEFPTTQEEIPKVPLQLLVLIKSLGEI